MQNFLTGTGWTRPEQDRHTRRTQRREQSTLIANDRKAKKKLSHDERAAERLQRQTAGYLPRAGVAGASELRTYRRLKVQPHLATSDVLAGAYPFLAEAGLGSEGIFIGHDAWSGGGFCYDPWTLYEKQVITNPNAVLLGVIGKGKSALAKSIATRSVAVGRRIYVPGDPKGEWSVVAEALGGAAIKLGAATGNRLNPLDEGPRPASMSDEHWRELVQARRRGLVGALAAAALGRALRSVEHTALDVALKAGIASAEVPTLPDVVNALFHPVDSAGDVDSLRADGRELAHALRRLVAGDLAGLFDGPSTVSFELDSPMVTVDLSAIHGSDLLMAMVMTCSSTWMEAVLSDPRAGQRWMIYDEAWRLMRHPALLARMQTQLKLARSLGPNLIILHRLSDLDAVGDEASEARALALGLLADCSTKIIYQQETSEAPRTAEILGLSKTERDELPKLQRAEGLWKIGERSFVVRHICTTDELEVYDTNARMRERS